MIAIFSGSNMFNLNAGLDLTCFSQDYRAAREKFITSIAAIPVTLVQTQQSFEHPLPGASQETLFCDVCCIGNNPAPEQLLVLMSATHGVEGFAGSAIQLDILSQVQTLLNQYPDAAILLIHAFNPWGFSWLRRYDDQGIDLNRNFVDFSKPLPQNSEYAALHDGLFNRASISLQELRTFWQDCRVENPTDRLAFGQYSHFQGCFYGGSGPSWSRNLLEAVTRMPFVQKAKRVAVVDLHTGLGPYGYGELINDHLPESSGFAFANAWYGANAQSAFLGESCSSVKVGLVDFHWHEIIGNRGCFVTLEFGTFPLEQLWLSLINEQLYHNRQISEGKVRQLSHASVQALKAFFYPAEESWQQQVLFRGRQVVQLALQGMSH